MQDIAFAHTSVLLSEATDALQPTSGACFIDSTVGAGGHAERILGMTGPDGRLLAIDADRWALQASEARLARFGERVTYVRAFSDHLKERALSSGFARVNGVLFDLGVSSAQLDIAARGFSFSGDAPLDMRMDVSGGKTAADVVNSEPVDDLIKIFRDFGEERYARRIATRIVRERSVSPIETTRQLAGLVSSAKPYTRTGSIHPATRVFQALRIAVNDELARLRRALPQAVDLLRSGGRLVVISFHSLEDRIVKEFMRTESTGCLCPPQVPVCVCGHIPSVKLVTRRPVAPTPTETSRNPRARSARMRVAERLAS